ncbi:MAG: hypothetical protein HZB46_11425 [Solirubrobacterales bacterium]|nr:hypothetical protein [Solirubrobacterales bacterium]
MRASDHGAESSRNRRGASEAGFALVEVMVSAVLLMVFVVATFPVLDTAAKRSSADRARGLASSLAKADQDAIRQLPLDKLANRKVTFTKTVDGIAFNVQSRAQLVRDASGVVSCTTDTAKAEYYKTSTTVTWPVMAGTAPVVVESIVSPGVGGLDPNKGTLTVKLSKESGAPASGISVNAGGISDTTDANGCAVFANMPAGVTPVTWSGPGYVDMDGDATGSPLGGTTYVAGGVTNIVTDSYDLATSAAITFQKDDGTFTSWPAAGLFNGLRVRRFPEPPATGPAVSSIAAGSLYPFKSGYSIYAGNCDGNSPGYYAGATGTPTFPPTGTTLTPGVPYTGPVIAPLKSYSFKVKRSGTGAAGFGAKPDTTGTPAQMATPAGCDATAAARTTTASFSGTSSTQTISLPYGKWILCADNDAGGSTVKKTVTIQHSPPSGTPASTATPTIDLTVGTTSGKCTP